MIPAPSHVQVVDSQTISSSIKPFTVYTIVTHIKDAGKSNSLLSTND